MGREPGGRQAGVEAAGKMSRELRIGLEMGREGRERRLGVSPASSQWKAHDELGEKAKSWL